MELSGRVHHLHHYAPIGIQVLHPSHVACRFCLISAAQSGDEHSDYHIPLSTIFHTMNLHVRSSMFARLSWQKLGKSVVIKTWLKFV
ncbi:hypothetical protein PHAVU_001G001800 [Phaseolus vulgaris]|uniref:Uncharacterized protein n=1 Tax=Phaseolus vulgaris TaxID=3885 RepID=V7CR56_PHAVU|nr:hypothetical protein PHAVU_001G001800g [Phaseolus vulgaris]ESW32604.1 hypothetical protein PHAVU_001G001800g [Phaseolus vulgaris]